MFFVSEDEAHTTSESWSPSSTPVRRRLHAWLYKTLLLVDPDFANAANLGPTSRLHAAPAVPVSGATQCSTKRCPDLTSLYARRLMWSLWMASTRWARVMKSLANKRVVNDNFDNPFTRSFSTSSDNKTQTRATIRAKFAVSVAVRCASIWLVTLATCCKALI